MPVHERIGGAIWGLAHERSVRLPERATGVSLGAILPTSIVGVGAV
jgi:hypothetical protein